MNDMNPFLIKFFDIIGIDIDHLEQYLSPNEKNYLNTNLVSIESLSNDLYSDNDGENLEVLLNFLVNHSQDIEEIWMDNGKKEILVKLYTSDTISGEYDCFRFNLSKFEQTYVPNGEKLKLYRIGRVDEKKENVGNSWATDLRGLKAYAQFVSKLEERPVFIIKVRDSEVLCVGKAQESELILKKGFTVDDIEVLSSEERHKIGV